MTVIAAFAGWRYNVELAVSRQACPLRTRSTLFWRAILKGSRLLTIPRRRGCYSGI